MQCGAVDAEVSRSLAPVSARGLQRGDDDAALVGVQSRFQAGMRSFRRGELARLWRLGRSRGRRSGTRLGQEGEIEIASLRQRHEALERILQLPHVSRPRIRGKALEKRGCDLEWADAEPARKRGEEVTREHGDVLGALA